MTGGSPDRGAKASPARRFVRLLVVGLLVLWAFVLGILVGQGAIMSPDQVASLKQSLTNLPVVGGWFREDAPPPTQESTEPKLSFYRELERTKSRDSKPAAPVKPAKEKTLPGQAAQPTPKPEPLTSSAKPPDKGAYVVQVASFKKQSQAKEMSDKLIQVGLSAYVRQVKLPEVGVRYRVRIGPFPDHETAKAAAGRIRLQQQLAAYVTRED
jgi:cell division septation protein DedD